MKVNYFLICIVALALVAGVCPMASRAQEPKPGAYATTSVTNKEVRAAAAFALEAQQKALQAKKDPEGAKLELVSILKAEQQVVAGMNYRLRLKVKLNGKEKITEAIIWWQAWRKPDPYKLTSWTWT